jgi:hypothetical protein
VQPTDRFGLLLGLLVAMFVTTAWFDESPARAVVGALAGAALVVAFHSTGVAATSERLAAVMVFSALGVLVLIVFDDEGATGALAAALQVVLFAGMIAAIGRRLFQHRRVTGQTVLGSICMYVLIGFVFAWTYNVMKALSDRPIIAPEDSLDVVYYSFTVLTTLGFGDLTPQLALVRRATVMEAMAGQIFLATLVARLVSLYGVDVPRPVREEPGEPDVSSR